MELDVHRFFCTILKDLVVDTPVIFNWQIPNQGRSINLGKTCDFLFAFIQAVNVTENWELTAVTPVYSVLSLGTAKQIQAVWGGCFSAQDEYTTSFIEI